MELKWNRCPFCGKEEIVFNEEDNISYAQDKIDNGHGYCVSIQCPDCGVDMKAFGNMENDELNDGVTLDEVIQALNDKWNRREELFSELYISKQAMQGRIDALVSENESLNKTIDGLRDRIKDERDDRARCFRELNELREAIIRRFVRGAEE